MCKAPPPSPFSASEIARLLKNIQQSTACETMEWPPFTVTILRKITMTKTISLLAWLSIVYSITNLTFAADKDKPLAKPSKKEIKAKETKPSYQVNSKNAIDIKSLYEQIRTKISEIKDDPFDPNVKSKKVKGIYDSYKNTLVFIPFEDHFPPGYFSNNQNLTTLSYHDGTLRFSFSDSELRFLSLGYVNWYDGKACGSDMGFSAYSVHITPSRVKSCLHGVGQVSECKNTYGYQTITLSNLDLERVRALSGNIERYVTIHNITSIDADESN